MPTTLREAVDRRSALQTEMEGIQAAHPNGAPFSQDVQTRWDAIDAEARPLNAWIERQAAIDDLDRRASGTPLDGGSGGFDALAAKVNILDVIRAQMGDGGEAAGRAREVSAELERRSGRKADGLFFDMARSGAPVERRVFTTTTPAGGPGSNLIATEVSPNLIDRLRERLVIRSLGATILSDLQGNLSIPRLKASATAYWVAENSPITMSDPQTDAVSLTPKHVGGLVEISRNMVQQPSLDVARMIENDLAQIIAVAIDSAAMKGGGPNQPKGLLDPASGIATHGMGGAAVTWADIINCIGAIATANGLSGSLAWLTNPIMVSKLRRTLKTTTDTSSNFLMTEPNQLAGYPLASTQNLPSDGTVVSGGGTLSSLIFGDWSQLVVGFWSEMDILINPYAETAYAKGNVQIRAMATADVTIKQPLAFSAILGAATA